MNLERRTSQLIIFTDLDGTLLDEKYSFEPAVPALRIVRELNIPLVICSSKTRREIEYYRTKLDNNHPFVSENGGGIFIPKGYFGSAMTTETIEATPDSRYERIALGAPYADLRRALESLRRDGFKVKGFGDMSAFEIADAAQMEIAEAEMAKERDFDEPLIFSGDATERRALLRAIEQLGFTHTSGRFLHIMGKSDKGKAVIILKNLYRRKFGRVFSIAVGDSLNDMPMLENADLPVAVQKPDGRYETGDGIDNLTRAEAAGPEGWNQAILSLLSVCRPSGR